MKAAFQKKGFHGTHGTPSRSATAYNMLGSSHKANSDYGAIKPIPIMEPYSSIPHMPRNEVQIDDMRANFQAIAKKTYKLHTSTSGPYSFPGIKSSGAAYSGLPQWVCRRLPGFWALLRPKSGGYSA